MLFSTKNVLQIIGVLVGLVVVYYVYTRYWTEGFESGDKKTLVLFHAPWCGHCQRLKPTWEQLVKKHSGDSTVAIKSVDCDKEPAKAKENDVQGFPTIILFKGGQKKVFSGERTLEGIESFINSA